MSKPLAFLPDIPLEIERAHDWYAERNPKIADQCLSALEKVLKTIEHQPERGAFHDERRLYRYRRFTRFPFVAVYREYVDRTLIVAIYHTNRNPDYWEDRLVVCQT